MGQIKIYSVEKRFIIADTNAVSHRGGICRLGVKATTLKAKAKAKAKDLASKAKAKAKDLAFEAKAKAKDLAFKAKAKAKDDVKANVNMVRCSVKTSKHRRLLQGW